MFGWDIGKQFICYAVRFPSLRDSVHFSLLFQLTMGGILRVYARGQNAGNLSSASLKVPTVTCSKFQYYSVNKHNSSITFASYPHYYIYLSHCRSCILQLLKWWCCCKQGSSEKEYTLLCFFLFVRVVDKILLIIFHSLEVFFLLLLHSTP